MEEFAPIEILGKQFGIKVERRRIKNAYARFKSGHIVIELPLHMGPIRSRTVTGLLYKRIKRSIEKNPNRYAQINHLTFRNGQSIRVLGRSFTIEIDTSQTAKKITYFLEDSTVKIMLPMKYDGEKADEKAARLAINLISEAVHKDLVERIENFNQIYFNSTVPRVIIRDALKVMGSCGPDNSIMINFRMLLADPKMLDYIIVHELTHTKFRNHSKMFWLKVSSVLPDYKETRRWLRNNLSTLSAS